MKRPILSGGGALCRFHARHLEYLEDMITVDDVRKADPDLADSVAYTNDEVQDAIASAQSYLEFFCRTSFIPQDFVFTFRSTGKGVHQVAKYSRAVTRVRYGANDFTTEAALEPFYVLGSLMYHNAPKGTVVTVNVMRQYEHGNIPRYISDAAAKLAAKYVLDPNSITSDMTMGSTNALGSFTYLSESEWRPTNIPSVDAIISRIRRSQNVGVVTA